MSKAMNEPMMKIQKIRSALRRMMVRRDKAALHLHVDDWQFAQVRAVARAEGRNPSEWVRSKVLRALKLGDA